MLPGAFPDDAKSGIFSEGEDRDGYRSFAASDFRLLFAGLNRDLDAGHVSSEPEAKA